MEENRQEFDRKDLKIMFPQADGKTPPDSEEPFEILNKGPKVNCVFTLDDENWVETLQKENAELKLAVEQAAKMLRDVKEYNVKIAYSARLFSEAYFTKSEKLLIAEEFDRCQSADQVKKVYDIHIENLRSPEPENEQDEQISQILYSGEFKKILPELLAKTRGYDPFKDIETMLGVVREHFKIEEDMKATDNPQTEQQLHARWNENWEGAVNCVNDIISVLNEVKNK